MDHPYGAWRRDLVNRDEKFAAVHGCHFDGTALECIVKSEFVAVNQTVSILAIEVCPERARFARRLFEADVEVSGWQLGLLVAFTLECHLVRAVHAWFDHDRYTSLLLLNRSAIKSQNLLLVGDLFACTIVHFLQSHRHSDIDVLGRLRLRLIKASVGSAKVTAFDLEIGPSDLRKVRAQIIEGV